ncbi:MAG: LytTR family transcriptional regulator [Clostridia bacterium]|nr:LytTR family transcriptional regulator [Clostridia bacterium]
MKVSIRNIDALSEEQVVIECVKVTPEIEEIRAFAQSKGLGLSGVSGSGQMERIALNDVYYFEAVDEKCFACTEKQVYEIRQRLYEIEKAYEEYYFVRCSKSVVLNLMKLGSISPALAGRYTAHMRNGEKLVISRKYAPVVIGRVMNQEG